MMKGKVVMKYLKINNNKVYYVDKENNEKTLDLINKEDLLYIIEKVFDDDFEYDIYDNDLIMNQVHNIIYKDISNKLDKLKSKKDEINEDFDELYKEAWNKYCN